MLWQFRKRRSHDADTWSVNFFFVSQIISPQWLGYLSIIACFAYCPTFALKSGSIILLHENTLCLFVWLTCPLPSILDSPSSLKKWKYRAIEDRYNAGCRAHQLLLSGAKQKIRIVSFVWSLMTIPLRNSPRSFHPKESLLTQHWVKINDDRYRFVWIRKWGILWCQISSDLWPADSKQLVISDCVRKKFFN